MMNPIGIMQDRLVGQHGMRVNAVAQVMSCFPAEPGSVI